jgi:GT2 family glycosyltransferase
MIYFGMVNTSSSAAYTFPALKSFFRHTPMMAGDRFFLFDNNGDLSLPETFERVEIVRNPEPRGFAANVNQVIAKARDVGADVIFPNNDIIFTEGWLDPLMERDDAILLPLCNQFRLYDHGALRLEPTMDLADYLGKDADLDAIVAEHRRTTQGGYAGALHMSFFCFRIPARIHAEIGLFDENFGRGGGEDVDYRLRAHLAGFSVAMAVKSYLLHFMGKSTWRGGESAAQIEARNQAYVGYFRQKWGADLANVFLFSSDWQRSVADLGIQDEIDRGDYSQAICRLLARRVS